MRTMCFMMVLLGLGLSVNYPALSDTTDNTDFSGVKTVQLGGKTFNLPYNYIGNFYRTKPDNYLQKYVATVVYPSFDPGYPKYTEGKRLSEKDRIEIEFFPMTEEGETGSEISSHSEYLRVIKMITNKDLEKLESENRYGLSGYSSDEGGLMLFYPSLHSPATLILCGKRTVPWVESPIICEHYFLMTDKKLAFKANYLDSILENWAVIEIKTKDLITSFLQP